MACHTRGPTSSRNTTTRIANLDLAADTIQVIVGAPNLGSSVLAQAGPGGSSVAGSAGFLFDTLTRGQGGYGEVSGLTATDFVLWGGAMVFDADTNSNYSLDSGPAANQFDFLSVALHEFGHAGRPARTAGSIATLSDRCSV